MTWGNEEHFQGAETVDKWEKAFLMAWEHLLVDQMSILLKI